MKSKQLAFWRGFSRGIAAPMMLFSSHHPPEISKHFLSPLYQPAKSDSESLRRDMERIGSDIRRAIQKYAEK